MCYVYDAARDRSDFVVLDASDMNAKPVATVHLPVRVPLGFHGNWIDDAMGEL
jgi:carotenoid cleavage dioxygenase-like enzyme